MFNKDYYNNYSISKFIGDFLMFLFGGVLFLVIIEFTLTKINTKKTIYNEPNKIYKFDKHLGFSFLPNKTWPHNTDEWSVNYSTNSLGLRNDEITEKIINEKRVLIIGDSQLFGYGIEKKNVLSNILEKKLNKNSLLPYSVINGSVPGAGTDYIYEYIKQYGLALKPDLILVGIYTNDFLDNKIGHKNKYTIIDSVKWRSKNYNKVLDNKNFIKNSFTYKFLFSRMREIKRKLWIMMNYKEQADVENIRLTNKIIQNLKNLCLKNNVDIQFIFVPSRYDVMLKNKSNYTLTRTYANFELVKSYLKILDIDYIDPYNLLFGMDAYYKEGHLNSIGHDIIANKLFKNLKNIYK